MNGSDSDWFPILLMGILLGVVITVSSLVGFHISPMDIAELEMSYADMAAIMLGAVSVIVTVLGVFIAILALWGYSQFKKSAMRAAAHHVSNALESGSLRTEVERLIISEVVSQLDGGKLEKIMEDRVNRALFSGAQRRTRSDDDPIGDEEKEYGE
jgi:hypothetical protein